MSDVLFEGLEARLFLSTASTDESRGPGDAPRDEAAARASRDSTEKAARNRSSHNDTRDIFGRDDRVRVRDTQQHPYAAVGQLDAWWDDGSGLSCTGAVIGRYHVLTAAHCVYTARDGKAESLEFAAARDGNEKPFGTVSSAGIRIDPDYQATQSSSDDYALVRLKTPLGDETGWFGYGNFKTRAFSRMPVSSAGYPGDLDGGDAMYRQSGHVSYASTYRIMAELDVAVGQSGSPIYRDDNTIVGVLSASNRQYTYSTRITARRFQRIENWIEKDERKLAAKAASRALKRAAPLTADAQSPFSTRPIAADERFTSRSLLSDTSDRERDELF